MANPTIRVKRSAVSGKIPTISQIDLGELAINTFDGKVFIEQDKSSVGVGTTVIVINPWSVGTGTNTYNTYFTAGNVGVGSTLPTVSIDVIGSGKFTGVITATSFHGNLYSTGVSTVSGFKFPAQDGIDGQFLKTDGFGNLSFASASGSGSVGAATSISDQLFTATQGQTSFTSTQDFTNKSVQIFLNGLKLRSGVDYSTSNPTTVTLVEGAKLGDKVNIVVSYNYTLDEEYFTATQGQTTFSLTGSFSSPDNIKVYVNGVKLRKTIDFGSSSAVTLVEAAKINDEIDLVCDNAEDYYTASAGQTTFVPSSTDITSENLQVFLNGIKLENISDYAVGSPAITLHQSLNAGDNVDVVITRS
jgi:hypothetical protein